MHYNRGQFHPNQDLEDFGQVGKISALLPELQLQKEPNYFLTFLTRNPTAKINDPKDK